MSNKEYFHMRDNHIADAKPASKFDWAIALLLRESGEYPDVSVGFGEIIIFQDKEKDKNNRIGTYKCSQELHAWQKKAIQDKHVGPITVVLNRNKMTAYISKSVFVRYIRAARNRYKGV